MFDGIIGIRRAYDNVIVMNGVEDNKLLKLNGTIIQFTEFYKFGSA